MIDVLLGVIAGVCLVLGCGAGVEGRKAWAAVLILVGGAFFGAGAAA